MKLNIHDKVYHTLLKDISTNGREKSDRTGTGTTAVFGRDVRFDMTKGFPLLTTKKMFTKGIIYELLWFLGTHMSDPKYSDLEQTNIKYLVDNNCNIWNEWAFDRMIKNKNLDLDRYSDDWHVALEGFKHKIKEDKEYARENGNLGPVYGKQWVNWEYATSESSFLGTKWKPNSINQIDQVLNTLRTNPDSRRILLNAWNVSEIPDMALDPCHYGFQVVSREMDDLERVYEFAKFIKLNDIDINEDNSEHLEETEDIRIDRAMRKHDFATRKISLKWNQRSVDTFLGLPFNIASYGFLLSMIAQQVNMIPGELIGSLGDTHIYSNHITQVDEQLKRTSFDIPILKLNKAKDIYSYKFEDFEILNYECHPAIKAPISV